MTRITSTGARFDLGGDPELPRSNKCAYDPRRVWLKAPMGDADIWLRDGRFLTLNGVEIEAGKVPQWARTSIVKAVFELMPKREGAT